MAFAGNERSRCQSPECGGGALTCGGANTGGGTFAGGGCQHSGAGWSREGSAFTGTVQTNPSGTAMIFLRFQTNKQCLSQNRYVA